MINYIMASFKTYLRANKIAVLTEILQKKNILFGPFSEKISKQDKIREWTEIHKKAQALGLVPRNKDVTYTRDTFWQNFKKCTMKKCDNIKQAGSGGGKKTKLTEIDEIVLSILGKESVAIVDLPVSEYWKQEIEDNIEESKEDITPDPVPEHYLLDVIPEPCNSATEDVSQKRKAKDECLHELKKKKLQLEIELLKKQSYLKSLEILKLERELGIEAVTE